MTYKFSIFGSKHREYARKKIACVCAATGTVMICATLGIQGISGPRTIDIYAKNPIFQKTVLQGAATNEELADDTLQGVESLFYTSSEQVPKSAEKIWKPLDLVLYPTADGLKYGSRKLEEAEKPQGIENQKLEEQTEEQQLQNRIKIKKKRKKQKIRLSAKDKAVLLRIVEAEATGETIKGKMLVANVVLNRVKDKTEFPDNVTDVVFDHTGGVCQFSPIDDGRYWDVTISKETREAVKRVLEGEDESKGALYFMARKYADRDNVIWFDENLQYLFTYGTHSFFK